jgi:hypothetical protein
MMKTGFDTDNVLYDVLKISSLKSAITGNVYKRQRPVDSNLEDVVINSLPITNQQLQTCVSNVNIFVPDVKVTVNGVVTNVPNEERLEDLTVMAIQVVADGIKGDFTWDIQQHALIQDNESDSHYSNIRIEFFVSNI